MAKPRGKFLCLDCGLDTGRIHEHYFVRDVVWFKAVNSKKGMLCVGCIEKRLGRELQPNDFTDCTINDPRYESKSLRLMRRMGYDM